MPDIADDHAAFQEAMRRAEAASGIERDAEGNETNGIEAIVRGETPVVTPELEGAVPVQASDQPLTPEPVVEVTPPETSEQQQEAPAVEPVEEDPRIELARLQARLEEKDSFIGRQSSEVGELRQAIAEMQQSLAARTETPAAPAQTIQITQELIDSNPAAATQAAFTQGNQQALEVAFRAWRDEEPFEAAAWRSDQLLAQQRAEFQATLAETQKQFEVTTAPLAETAKEQANGQAWKEAFDKVKATRPDFIANAERLLTEVAPLIKDEHPDVLEKLTDGNANEKATALVFLYAYDKMGNPAAMQEQLAAAAEEAAAEAAAARAGAGVVNGQTTAGQPSVEQTEEETEQQRYLQRQRGKASLAKGWTGRSSS